MKNLEITLLYVEVGEGGGSFYLHLYDAFRMKIDM